MLPTSRTHPRLHRRNPQINFLIVTNHRYVLKDSDLLFSQHFKKIVGRFNGHTIETTKSTLHSIVAIRSPIHPCPIANTKTLLSQVQSTGSYQPTTFKSSSPSKQCERQGLLLHPISRRLCKVPSEHSPPGDAATAAIYYRPVLAFIERCDTLSFLEIAWPSVLSWRFSILLRRKTKN